MHRRRRLGRGERRVGRTWMGRMRSSITRMMRCVLLAGWRAGKGADGWRQFGVNQRENARQKEDLRVLLEHFDAGQMDRYEAYRRSGLAKASVRKVSSRPSCRSLCADSLLPTPARQPDPSAVRLPIHPDGRTRFLQGVCGRDRRER